MIPVGRVTEVIKNYKEKQYYKIHHDPLNGETVEVILVSRSRERPKLLQFVNNMIKLNFELLHEVAVHNIC